MVLILAFLIAGWLWLTTRQQSLTEHLESNPGSMPIKSHSKPKILPGLTPPGLGLPLLPAATEKQTTSQVGTTSQGSDQLEDQESARPNMAHTSPESNCSAFNDWKGGLHEEVNLSAIERRQKPLCDLYQQLKSYGDESPPAIAPNHPDAIYQIGDPFLVTIRNLYPEPGYVYTFYLTSSGQAFVFPSIFGLQLNPGEEARSGDYQVTAPLGAELIVAVLCKSGHRLPRFLKEVHDSERLSALLVNALADANPSCAASTRFLEIR